LNKTIKNKEPGENRALRAIPPGLARSRLTTAPAARDPGT